MLFLFYVEKESFKNMKKKSILLIRVIHIPSKSHQKIKALHWESLLPVQLVVYSIFFWLQTILTAGRTHVLRLGKSVSEISFSTLHRLINANVRQSLQNLQKK